MIYVRLDEEKDKHDCLIKNSEGEIFTNIFTIANSKDGSDKLLKMFDTCASISTQIKVTTF